LNFLPELMSMNPKTTTWGGDQVRALSSAYWQACALHALVQTGLAGELAKGPAAPAELCARLDLDARGTGLLLTALTTLGLLERRGSANAPVYALVPEALPAFTPGSPGDVSNAVLHMADMVADWAKLAECVRSGRPVDRAAPEPGSGPSPGRTHFYRAMRDIARQQAPGLAARLGLHAGQSLLDLAGGPGVYGLTFAEETPGLAATVLDLPGAEQFFREEAARHPGAAGVVFRAGNYEEADLGGPYDVVWLSQVLHSEGPEECRRLLARAVQALKPGGTLWVQEFVVQETGGHPFSALFSLNMLVNTEHGQSYDAAQLGEMMTGAGLAQVELAGPTREGSPAALMRGQRPA
jgi:hypothetical protein